jgi:hypothetical protein
LFPHPLKVRDKEFSTRKIKGNKLRHSSTLPDQGMKRLLAFK